MRDRISSGPAQARHGLANRPDLVADRLHARWIVDRAPFWWALAGALGPCMVGPLLLGIAAAVVAPAVAAMLAAVVGTGMELWPVIGLCAAVVAERLVAWASTVTLRRRCELAGAAAARCLARRALRTDALDEAFSTNLVVARYPEILAQYVFVTRLVGNIVALLLLVGVAVWATGPAATVAALAGVVATVMAGNALNDWQSRAAFEVERREAARTRLVATIATARSTLRRQSLRPQALAAFAVIRAGQVRALRRRVTAKAGSAALFGSLDLLALGAALAGLWLTGQLDGIGPAIVLLTIVRLVAGELLEAMTTFSSIQDARPVLAALAQKWLDVEPTPSTRDPFIPSGARAVVLGPTGSGKSVLLRRLAHEQPGTVLLIDRSRPLLPGSVRDAVTLADATVDEARYLHALAISGLAADVAAWGPVGDVRRTDDDLSDGERMRVHLAQAAYWEPDLLLLDDAFAAFDAATAAAVIPAFLSGRTVIYATSRPELAVWADYVVTVAEERVAILPGGRVTEADLAQIVEPGTAAQIVELLRRNTRPMPAGTHRATEHPDTTAQAVGAKGRPTDREPPSLRNAPMDRPAETETPSGAPADAQAGATTTGAHALGVPADDAADLVVDLPSHRALLGHAIGLLGRGGAAFVAAAAVLGVVVYIAAAQIADGPAALGPLLALAVTGAILGFAAQLVAGRRAAARMTTLQQRVLALMIDTEVAMPLARVTTDLHMVEFRAAERLLWSFTGVATATIVLGSAAVTEPVLLWTLSPTLVLVTVVHVAGRRWRARAQTLAIAAREPLLRFAEAAITLGPTLRHPGAVAALDQRFGTLSDQGFWAGRRSLDIRAIILVLVETIAIALFTVIALTALLHSTTTVGLADGALVYLAYIVAGRIAGIVENVQSTDALQTMMSRVAALTGHSVLTVEPSDSPRPDLPRIGATAGADGDLLLPTTPPLTLMPGRVVALTGRSGAGKSVLLRSAVDLPTEPGSPVSGLLLEADVPPLGHTVASFLDPVGDLPLPRLEHAWSATHLPARRPPALDSPLDTLAHGERQLANLARALLLGPDVLLLDEALSATDVATEAHVLGAELFPTTAVLAVLHRRTNIDVVAREIALVTASSSPV